MPKPNTSQEISFSTGDIAESVGVPRSVVADWLARQIISAPQTPGRGRSRRFSFWNVVEAWIARDLNRMGIRAGSITTIIAIARTEYNEFNTYLKRKGGQEDCVLLIGFGADGAVAWIRRQGAPERTKQPDFDKTVVVLRIDVNAAIARVESALRMQNRG